MSEREDQIKFFTGVFNCEQDEMVIESFFDRIRSYSYGKNTVIQNYEEFKSVFVLNNKPKLFIMVKVYYQTGSK